MDGWTLYDKLEEFDFSNGKKYLFKCVYDLKKDDDIELLDNDSADASTCVKKLGLNYDINSRHYSNVVDGDRITDMVEVTWEFCKSNG